ncbi:ceramide kinase [Camelus ferus]|nr:ceramide kinase [Camelus ferus]
MSPEPWAHAHTWTLRPPSWELVLRRWLGRWLKLGRVGFAHGPSSATLPLAVVGYQESRRPARVLPSERGTCCIEAVRVPETQPGRKAARADTQGADMSAGALEAQRTGHKFGESMLQGSLVSRGDVNQSLGHLIEFQSGSAHPATAPDACSVPISEIITVEETDVNGKHYSSGKWQKMEKPYAFTVHRVRRARRHRWRRAQVTFCCADEQLLHLWLQTLRELLAKLTSRPKHLLVFINPFGGKGQGKRIYDRKVAPLFTLASVSTEIIVTERANHAKESLYELSIDKFDGIVCVGGDGMFSEVLHGLVGRTQRDAGVDQNQPRAALAPSPLRIGIIPAGSTDCVCYSTVGTNDAETSALHIIVGDSLAMDVSSVHHDGALLRYSVSLLGYGFYGDIIRDSERKRWMGLVRYDFSGLKTFLSHHCYEGTVSFLPAQHTMMRYEPNRLRAPAVKWVRSPRSVDRGEEEEVEEWKVVCGQFLAINATNMSCACPRCPRGLSPSAHLGDGSSDLILIRKCSRFNFLRFLVRHTNQGDQFDFTFVEVYRVKRFQFVSQAAEDEDGSVRGRGKKRFGQICSDQPPCCCAAPSSSWNCDGEVLRSPAVDVRSQPAGRLSCTRQGLGSFRSCAALAYGQWLLPVPPVVSRVYTLVATPSLQSLLQPTTVESALPAGYREVNGINHNPWLTTNTPLSSMWDLLYLPYVHQIHSPTLL